MIVDLKNSDNTPPVVDVHTITGAGGSPASVTTTVNDDFILVPVLNFVGNSAVITSGQQPLGTSLNIARLAVLYGGQQTAGSTSGWMPSALVFSGAGSVIAETIAIKQNTTTASLFTGAGAEVPNTGSATRITLASPASAVGGNALLAGVVEGTPGVAITPPPVIGMRSADTPFLSTATNTITVGVPPGTLSGDIMIAHILTAGSTGWVPQSGWTLILHDTTSADNWYYYRTATSSESSSVWSITGNNIFAGSVVSVFDSSGGTLAIGNSGFLSTASSVSSFQSYQITTAHNNALIYNEWNTSGGITTLTLPPTEATAFNLASKGYAVGWFNQHTAGLSATQTASDSSHPWRTAQIEVYSPTAAALSGSTVWAHQTPTAVTDPTGAVQLDAYSMVAPNTESIGPSLFTFASSEATSDGFMAAFGNLNTTTPVDASQSLINAGEAQTQEAPLTQPTAKDEFALSFNAYTGCSPSGTRPGQYPQNMLIPTASSRISGYYTTPNAAVVAQAVDECGLHPYASITLGLQAATTPTAPTANVDINQHVIEIFSTTAPVPPPASVGAWFF